MTDGTPRCASNAFKSVQESSDLNKQSHRLCTATTCIRRQDDKLAKKKLGYHGE